MKVGGGVGSSTSTDVVESGKVLSASFELDILKAERMVGITAGGTGIFFGRQEEAEGHPDTIHGEMILEIVGLLDKYFSLVEDDGHGNWFDAL